MKSEPCGVCGLDYWNDPRCKHNSSESEFSRLYKDKKKKERFTDLQRLTGFHGLSMCNKCYCAVPNNFQTLHTTACNPVLRQP